MAYFIVGISVILVLCLFWGSSIINKSRAKKALQRAQQAGVSVDDQGNIDAATSFAGMMLSEEESGKPFTGKQARFMELMRVVSEGPKSPDEIRFLFANGIDPVVRPDGLVYVPCIENEHLYMDGELELIEADLDAALAKDGFLTVCENVKAS